MGSALVTRRPSECRLNIDGLSCSTPARSTESWKNMTKLPSSVQDGNTGLPQDSAIKWEVRDKKMPPVFWAQRS